VTPAARRELFERLARANPDPKTELRYRTPFELLVAVVLSAQATDKGVNKATERLFEVANTPAAIARLGVEGLIPFVSSIGLYRNKAKNIVAAAAPQALEVARRVGHAAGALRLPDRLA
jgi:endonuclease-3